MCDHVEYLRIDCGNAHGTLERRRLQYTLQAVIFPTDMWKQYSLQNTLQAVIFPADLQFVFSLVWITQKSICTCLQFQQNILCFAVFVISQRLNDIHNKGQKAISGAAFYVVKLTHATAYIKDDIKYRLE